MTITAKFSEILKKVLDRLSYISGKQARTCEDYFRHSACGVDSALLHDFFRECAARIQARLGRRAEGSELIQEDQTGQPGPDTFFHLKIVSKESDAFHKAAMGILLERVFISYIIYRWLLHTGMEGAEAYLEETEEALQGLIRGAGGGAGLFLRPISPF